MAGMTLHLDTHIPDLAWDTFVERRADGHVLQTSAWAALKSRFGWSAGRVAVLDGHHIVAGASILFRSLPLGLGTLAYIPKGPCVDWDNSAIVPVLFDGLGQLCRARRAFALRLEPDMEDQDEGQKTKDELAHTSSVKRQTSNVIPAPVPAKLGRSGQALHLSSFRLHPSSPIQPRRTILIDLDKTEDELLAAMHPKTRYNIRLAARKGVTVRVGTTGDLPAFHVLMQTTGERDGFGVHSPDYYRAAFESFVARGWARLFMAQVSEADTTTEPIAAIMVFAFGGKAWYIYGASGNAHREKMPNHALQWEAIRWAKTQGCATYDLWGVPDEDESTLEVQCVERHDGLWGVYRFKRGFGGRLVRYVGAFDRVYNPLLYRAFLLAQKRRNSLAT